MVAIDLISFIVGLIYGYVNPGKEKKGELFKKGAKIGVGLAVVLALLNLLLGGGLLGIAAGGSLIIIAIVYLTVMFIVGTIAGDWLEEKFKK
ncbi:MAG: hypothetical protein V3V92_04800 [Candidatus Hydrothermarchaeales archaeon]